MKLCVIALIFALILAISSASRINYSGNLVLRAIPETPEQLEFLRDWESTSSIDFWILPAAVKQFADIRINAESYAHVTQLLAERNISHKILIADLGQLDKKEQQNIALRRALYNGNKAIDVENYHTYEEVMAYLTDLANTNPIVSLKTGGTSEEGRDIVQAIISSDLSANKPVHFFDCNIHAREWITGATCIWIIDQITSGYGSDPEITALVDQYDWKFIPIANPDGYAYTWNTDRNWRKTRIVNNGSTCIGVDVNRNFLAGFGGTGSSGDPCSNTFRGNVAFSEKESSALRDLIAADRGRVKTAVSMHSYSQMFLSAYGYTTDLPPEYPEMFRAMEIAVGALTATYGTKYTYGNTAVTIYIASGVTTDHYYENEGIVHSYTIELRDSGTYGFQLPPDQIVPTAIETWNGLKAMINAI
ncbi:carboxypeptidase B-like [Daphnia pulex]|uniref:carboxypeptidase B-like n=1 Tax=Daphnia pulex TaxID=6669 RepID=UPI001EDE24C8|nr:carboxypeptidase B-like [Daphnia pulex]